MGKLNEHLCSTHCRCQWRTHVYGTANTWHNYCDQLEELGCEVVEDQTDDYDIQDLGTIDDEIGVVPINKLLTSTDFIAH
jgi:hypothetical protein